MKDGGYEATVVVRTRCGYNKLKECAELLHRIFHLKLKRVSYKN